MASMSNSSVVFGMAFTLFLSITYRSPHWVADALRKHPGLAAVVLQHDPQLAKRTESERRLFFVLGDNLQARHRIIGELIRGQRTFLETAACFQQLDARIESPLRQRMDSGPSGACRQVLYWLSTRVAEGDERDLDEAVCQVEAEWHEIQSRPGPLVLPPLPPAAYAEVRSGPSVF